MDEAGGVGAAWLGGAACPNGDGCPKGDACPKGEACPKGDAGAAAGGVSKGEAALAVDHASKRLAVKKTEPHTCIL